jgi:periplasmic divalent cation tolerance protein
VTDVSAPDLVMIWSTWPDVESAEKGARLLVDRRLAACVVVSPGATSVYRWEGVVETAIEATMWVKTRASLAGEASRTLVEVHPYEVPAVLVLPVGAVHPPYAAWVATETAPM